MSAVTVRGRAGFGPPVLEALVLPTSHPTGCLDPHNPSAEDARGPLLGGGRDPGLGEG